MHGGSTRTEVMYQYPVRRYHYDTSTSKNAPEMGVTCPGCGEVFKRSGISHHFRQSKDPQCHPAATPVHGPGTPSVDEDEPQDRMQIPVDPSGDLFGDYLDYLGLNPEAVDEGDQDMDNNLGGEPREHHVDTQEDEEEVSQVDYLGINSDAESEGDQDMEDSFGGEDQEYPDDTQEDDEEALREALLAEEHRLEPEQQAACPDAVEQEPEDTPAPAEHTPFRLRGGFERPLANRPEIEEFGNQNAGTVYARVRRNGNQDYRQSISSTESPNPYAPFSSRLDWEIARWAKMRGPGSNSLTELLRIEGMSLPVNGSKIRSDLLIILIRSLKGLA